MYERARAIQERLVALRRDIHQHPELGFRETRTAQLVADTLRSLGIRVQSGVGKTGVVGYLGEGKPVVALRADMDALPIQEMNQVPYASQVPGVMHACGHDAHTAILLGVAMLLRDLQLPGQVRFLFQPCEESGDDEGKSGAERMIEDGAMEGVDVVMALHVGSALPTGAFEIDAGRLRHPEPRAAGHPDAGHIGRPDPGGKRPERTEGTRMRVGPDDHLAREGAPLGHHLMADALADFEEVHPGQGGELPHLAMEIGGDPISIQAVRASRPVPSWT